MRKDQSFPRSGGVELGEGRDGEGEKNERDVGEMNLGGASSRKEGSKAGTVLYTDLSSNLSFSQLWKFLKRIV